MAETSPLLLISLTIRRQQRNLQQQRQQQQQQNNNDGGQQQQHQQQQNHQQPQPQPQPRRQKMTRPRSSPHSSPRLLPLPIIHEAEGSSSDASSGGLTSSPGSSHSRACNIASMAARNGNGGSFTSSSSSSSSNNSMYDNYNNMSHQIVWPPVNNDDSSWPPRNNRTHNHSDNTNKQGQGQGGEVLDVAKYYNCNYGSILQNHPNHEDYISSSPSSSDDSGAERREYNYNFTLQHYHHHQHHQAPSSKRYHGGGYIRTWLISILIISLSAAVWLPLAQNQPSASAAAAAAAAAADNYDYVASDDDDDDHRRRNDDASKNDDDDDAPSPFKYFKQIYYDNDDDDSDDDFDYDDASSPNNSSSYNPTWYPHHHVNRKGRPVANNNHNDDGSYKIRKIRSSPPIIHDVDDDDDDDDTVSSYSIPVNISFADLAAMMMPRYFQTTLDLCVSTIVPERINKTTTLLGPSNNTNGTTTTTTTTTTTSVMPNEVYLLRKQMLKTRDLFDVFSPVYSKHSSLDDYKEDDNGAQRRHTSWGGGGDRGGSGSFDLALEWDSHYDGRKAKKRKDSDERSYNSEYGKTTSSRDSHYGERKAKKREGNDERSLYNSEYDKTSTSDSIFRTKNKKSTTDRKSHNSDQNDTTVEREDLWKILRRYLNKGYNLVGDFQDLDHARIKYSPTQLAWYQLQVWEWNQQFMTFVKENKRHISLYLSIPCKKKTKQPQLVKKSKEHKDTLLSCRHAHSHSSHLFWGKNNATSHGHEHEHEQLPDGNRDRATSVLLRLGNSQLKRAEMYLRQGLVYDHVISMPGIIVSEEEGIHEIYHNLRKELRSFLDEVDLFGHFLLPDSLLIPEIERGSNSKSKQRTLKEEQVNQALKGLKRARKILGDMNDDYVAYVMYREWNEYPDEQLRLQGLVDAQWNYFRLWTNQAQLFAKLQFLQETAQGHLHLSGNYSES